MTLKFILVVGILAIVSVANISAPPPSPPHGQQVPGRTTKKPTTTTTKITATRTSSTAAHTTSVQPPEQSLCIACRVTIFSYQLHGSQKIKCMGTSTYIEGKQTRGQQCASLKDGTDSFPHYWISLLVNGVSFTDMVGVGAVWWQDICCIQQPKQSDITKLEEAFTQGSIDQQG